MPPVVATTWAEWRNSIRIAFFGTVWALISGLGPSLLLFIYNYTTYENPFEDLQQFVWVSVPGLLLGLLGYWKKHEALLMLPPCFKDVPLDVVMAQMKLAGGNK
jgi:hypothetical protein